MATNPITKLMSDDPITTTQASQTSQAGPTQSSPMTTMPSPVTTPASVTKGILYIVTSFTVFIKQYL
jgi:hypothetical protein